MTTRKYLIGFLTVALLITLANLPHLLAAGEETQTVKQFTDVSAMNEHVKAIEYLQLNKIVEGYGDGTYKPDQEINRAEFLKILMEVAKSNLQDAKNCYPDVTDQWFAPYVCAAKAEGLVQGYPDGKFRPEQKINFAEASKIVTKTLKLVENESDPVWYKPFVISLEERQAIPADVSGFTAEVTRGQMAEMVWRLVAARTYKPYKTYSDLEQHTTIPEKFAKFESCKELYDYFYDNANKPSYIPEKQKIPSGSIRRAISYAEKGGGYGALASEDYSATNVQVKGVDEADTLKNDGEYIYFLQNATIKIVKAAPAEAMKEVSTITFDENFDPSEIYLDNDTLIVIGKSYYYGEYVDDFSKSNVTPQYYYSDGAMKVYTFDISDKTKAKKIREIAVEGDYSSSRKVGNIVYTVATQENNFWPWLDSTKWQEEDLVPLYTENGTLDTLTGCKDILYLPQNIDETKYLIVSAIPLDKDAEVSHEVMLGSSDAIYSSIENLYVADNKYGWGGWYKETGEEEKTYLHKFNLNKGDVAYQGTGAVPGTVLNQFSMDEYKGNFRIATTKSNWGSNEPSLNNLYVLGPELTTIGKVEGLAPGEKIYSTRFIGERAYMVTFVEVDPLFVISLKDPTKPKVLGELKIPGFSTYLHPYDENHLIGFGLETKFTPEEVEGKPFSFAWIDGIKLAMFDVTDVENPKELHREIIGDRGTSSPLIYNHKALLYSATKGVNGGALMAFPIAVAEIPEEIKADPELDASTYGKTVFQGAYVYDINPKDGFTLRGTITHYGKEELNAEGYYWYGPKDIERILYIGNVLYTVSQNGIMANNILSPLTMLKSLGFKN